MSLCYDFQKSTMITFAIFAISLTVGFVLLLGFGYLGSVNASLPLDGILGPQAFKESDFVVKYCAEHASSDNNNTVQDLVDNLTITWAWFNGETCETVKQFQNDFQHLLNLADEQEVQTVLSYCLAHASEVAQGKNVVQDLVKSGMVKSGFENYSCQDLKEEYEKGLELKNAVANAQAEVEAQKSLDFTYDCYYGNLTPSQWWECRDADKDPDGPICLFEKDREDEDPSIVQPLTSAERLECENKGYTPTQEEEEEEEEEDTKE